MRDLDAGMTSLDNIHRRLSIRRAVENGGARESRLRRRLRQGTKGVKHGCGRRRCGPHGSHGVKLGKDNLHTALLSSVNNIIGLFELLDEAFHDGTAVLVDLLISRPTLAFHKEVVRDRDVRGQLDEILVLGRFLRIDVLPRVSGGRWKGSGAHLLFVVF